MNNQKAFTLTEVMVVVILLGIIAAFGLPNYQKAVDRAHERDAIMQLTALHAANLIYKAQSGLYLTGTALPIASINTGLNINLIANDLTFSYTSGGTPNGSTFTATAACAVCNPPFTVIVDEEPIARVTPFNPCCLVTPCPTLTTSCN